LVLHTLATSRRTLHITQLEWPPYSGQMNMAGAQDRSSSDGAGKPGVDDSIMPNTLILTSTAAKYWAKRHRTFVASSASGMLGSLLTVCYIPQLLQKDADPTTVSFGYDQDAHAIVRRFQQTSLAITSVGEADLLQ